MTTSFAECSDFGPLPCFAIPRSQCFGKSAGWKFTVAKSDPNWRRTLTAHENLHLTAQPGKLSKFEILQREIIARSEADIVKSGQIQ